MAALAKRSEVAALQAAYAKGDVRVRLIAIQTLARIPGDPARAAVRAALDDADPRCGCWPRTRSPFGAISARSMRSYPLLGDPDANLRRSAAAALGRLGDRRAIPHLLKAGEAAGTDRFLDHALAYALYEIGDDASLAAD